MRIPRSSVHGMLFFFSSFFSNIIAGFVCAGTGFRSCHGTTGYAILHGTAGYGIQAFAFCTGPRGKPESRTIPGIGPEKIDF